jgi:hypothetical protein
MPIHFECPNCRAKYDVAEDMVGKTMLCRECEQRVPVHVTATAGKAVAAKGTAASAGAPTRRNAVLIGLAGFLPGALLGWFGGYFWKRPLPWEGPHKREASEGNSEGEQTAEGQQPGDGQPRGRRGGGGPRGGAGRGGRRGNQGPNPRAPNPPMPDPPMQ